MRLETKSQRLQLKFYVYEHWRPDVDVCFYVGKGRGRRAYRFGRNIIHDAIVAELGKLGMCVEVRLVAHDLTEKQAFKIERKRIAFWRASGVDLANRTDGGEGYSGFIRPLGISLSSEARRKVSQARKGIKFSEEHRAKLAKRKLGVKRRPFTPETIAKMRIAAYRREQARRDKYGAGKVRRSHRVKGFS